MAALKYIVFFVFVAVSLMLNLNMPKKIIDHIQMVTVAGYDTAEEDKLQGTVVTPDYTQPDQVDDVVYTDTAGTVYENRVKLNAKSTERLLNGKLQAVLYNQDLAEQGIIDFIEFLTRDPSIGGDVYLAVTEGPTRDIINAVQTNKGMGIFFKDLFEHNIEHGNLPQINLKEFVSGWKSATRDPFLPLLTVSNGVPELTSIAFFDDNQMVDTLPVERAIIFKMLYEEINDGQYQYKSSDYYISVENLETAKDVSVENSGGSTAVTINLQLRGSIREFTGTQVLDKLANVESDIEKDITQNAEKLISRFQELAIDPLNIEGDVKASNRHHDKEQFKDVYEDMPINVKTDVKLTESGTRR
ncbi:Ger(x)C family spore germination protein [Lentibacillus salinarum]|uniref:Ger(X)C family spore germination protein n=1 Tax=Lentibacillus salinarum TaxID=446820 RepID=A0ABW3ZYE7_9BACI